MELNTKINFLVKYNRKIEVLTIDQQSHTDFPKFRDMIRSRFQINRKFKTYFYLEGDGITGTVPLDQHFYDEIINQAGEFCSNNIVSIRIHTVHSFVFSGNLPSLSTIVKPTIPTGVNASVSLGKMAQIKKAEEIRRNEKKDEVQDEVDEWADIVETNVDDEGNKTKTISTPGCSITVGDPVKKPIIPSQKEEMEEKKVESNKRGVSPPKFDAKVSKLSGYVNTSKFQAEVDLYEKNGPTGKQDGNKVKIQFEITNVGQEKLNKSFAVYQIKGNANFKKVPLPVIRPGKKKIVTIRLEFDQFVTSGVCFFSLGYEETGQKRYFGKILKVEFQKFKGYAKMRFVTDKEASKSLSSCTQTSGDEMSFEEVQKLKKFIDDFTKSNYKTKKYGPDIYTKFRKVRAKIPNIKKYLTCELIGSNLFAFQNLVKYAEKSKEFKRLMKDTDEMTQDEIDKVRKYLDGLDYKTLSNKRYGGYLFTKFKQIRAKTPYINKPATCELINSNLIPFDLLLKYAGESLALLIMLREKRF